MENKLENLQKFAVNLCERASQGKLDPVIGRDDEIRRVLQILSRRTKNNPILVGEPGVGKTAISEGIAQKIIDGQVPENLKSKRIYSLDLGALIAGAKYQGEFEERLKGVVKEVVESDGQIIAELRVFQFRVPILLFLFHILTVFTDFEPRSSADFLSFLQAF